MSNQTVPTEPIDTTIPHQPTDNTPEWCEWCLVPLKDCKH